jgi:glycolate oxidase subunit GlcD
MLDVRVLKRLKRIVGEDGLLTSPSEVMLYAYDSSMAKGRVPEAVVLPRTAEQVAGVVRLAQEYKVPFTARGAGTNLSGGTVTPHGGIVISLARMDRILEIDVANQCAVVEPGVVNLHLQQALAPLGYEFRPDPASQKASTIGGNVGENAGGPHCLKYGVTTNHVLGMEVVLPSGEIINFGGKAADLPGYDLIGLLIGSEGTLGIITRIIVRVSPLPKEVRCLMAVFDKLEKAGAACRDIIAAGILPAALEIMDRLMIWAVVQSGLAAYPEDAEAVLVVELDGIEGLDRRLEQCVDICRQNEAQEVSAGWSPQERERLWAGRRAAFGAGAKISPAFLVNDGVVPRDKLPEALRQLGEVGRKWRVKIGNVFHAGDGNLHPNIYYKADDAEERERAHQAAYEVFEICARAGGTISGEHGIGMEKIAGMPLIFSADELEIMRRMKHVFDPKGLCNPGKVLPHQGWECGAEGSEQRMSTE